MVEDPEENNNNLAETYPDVVVGFQHAQYGRLDRQARKGDRPAQPHAPPGRLARQRGRGRPFKTSQQAYDTLHIGDPTQAARLQAEAQTVGSFQLVPVCG
ncbi:MAG: hypothetical protein R2911_10105 [Caldilineaceae bacterium]